MNELGIVRARRHIDVFFAAHPEDDRRDEHQYAGNAERHRRTVMFAKQDRHQQRGEERTEIDRPVEAVVDDLRQMSCCSA
jgi:hypothetical protein